MSPCVRHTHRKMFVNSMKCLLVSLVLWALAITGHAAGQVFRVPTRDGVVTTLFWEPAANPTATVLLFPGGAGGFGQVEGGLATGGNFLVRSAPHFVAQGFNVAIFGRTSDLELGWTERTDTRHMTDISKVLDFVKEQSNLPVWIVGTSRGTVSATAAAIHLQRPDIAGVVLTSSVVRFATPGAVPRQNLQAIRRPVLVYHHAQDACKHCQASETPNIIKGLTQAPIKKLMVVNGGGNPTGDVCAGQHWHGFIGMEREAVEQIGGWIKAPTN